MRLALPSLLFAALFATASLLPSPARADDDPGSGEWARCQEGISGAPGSNCLKAAQELRAAGRQDEMRQALFRSCLQRDWEGCWQLALQREQDGQQDAALAALDKACKNGFSMDKACKRAAAMRSGAPLPPPPPPEPAPPAASAAPASPAAAVPDEQRQCLSDRHLPACTALAKAAMRPDPANGKPSDPAAALRYATVLCESDSAVHCQLAGALLARGEGVPADPAAAYRLYSHGCLQQHVDACLGASVTALRLTPPDPEAAEAAAQHARMLDPGNAKAQALLDRLAQAKGR